MNRPYPHCVVFAFFFEKFNMMDLRHLVQCASILSGFMPRNETVTTEDHEQFELALKFNPVLQQEIDENIAALQQLDASLNSLCVSNSRWETPHGTSWNIEFCFPVQIEPDVVLQVDSMIMAMIIALQVLEKNGAEVSARILWEKHHASEGRPLCEMTTSLTHLFANK